MGTSWAPWDVLQHWSPFKIDALGLVTLLGAEEINAAVGRLVSSAYLEYLPLLGAYVIAGDRFTEKAAGWNLYNISQGIHTTDLAAWLTRWMLSQNFEATRNFVVWKVTPPRSRKNEISINFLVGFVFNGFLIAGTLLSKDWYGFANAMAMVLSIIVRVYVIGQQRLAVDAMIDKAVANLGPPKGDSYEAKRYEYKHWKEGQKEHRKEDLKNRKAQVMGANSQNHSSGSNSSTQSNGSKQGIQHVHPGPPPTKPVAKDYIKKDPSESWIGNPIKVVIIQSDSKAVTFWMPNQLVIPPSLFIEGPIILNPKAYFVMRSIGWLAFAIHIVAIGMADLATQLYTVALIVLPTVLLVQKTGCDDSDWMTTFASWKNSLFHTDNKPSKPAQKGTEEKGNAAEFKPVRECWIGSRLKAEVYEWPVSYELREEGANPDKKWVSGGPAKNQERSKKRQDLYAWLALTRDEEESMDKWDLFPHIRKGNNSWWETYKLKKHALKDNRNSMGPQYVAEAEPPKKTGTQSSQDPVIKPFNKQDRTATVNFVDTPGQPSTQSIAQTQVPDPRQSISLHAISSAYPASAPLDEEVPDGTAAKPDDGNSNPPAATATGPTPELNTATAPVHIGLGATLTQSPTTTNATDDQP